jgi:hypothetical protein
MKFSSHGRKQDLNSTKKHEYTNRMVEAIMYRDRTKKSTREFMSILPLLTVACVSMMTSSSDSIHMKIATSIGVTVISRQLILRDSNKILAKSEEKHSYYYNKIRSTDIDC